MRAAPPVTVRAAWHGGWWAAAVGLWLACAASVIGWLVWHLGTDGVSAGLGAAALGAVGLLAAAGTSMQHARRRPVWLTWDGTRWLLAPAQADTDRPAPGRVPAVGDVDRVLDLGSAVLLRWRPEPEGARSATPAWLPLARTAQPEAWHALRVALNLPGRPAAPAEGQA